MKFLIISIFVVLCTAHHNSPPPEDFQQARQECFDSQHVPEDIREQIRNYEYPDIEVVQHYVRCVATKLGTWTDSQGFDTEKLYEIVEKKHPDEEVRAKVNKCIDDNQEKSDVHSWAYRQHICFVRSGVFEPIKAKFLPH